MKRGARAPGLGGLVTTYAYFDDVDPAEVARTFVRRLRDAREERGMAPPRWVRMQPVTDHAETIHRDGVEPQLALRHAIGEVTRPGGRTRGLALEAIWPELMDIPEELIAPFEISVAVAASHTRAEGGAWGQHVLLVVYRE